MVRAEAKREPLLESQEPIRATAPRPWLIKASVALVALVTFVSFLNSLDNDFVNWDDSTYVTQNPMIKSLSWSNLGRIFSSPKTTPVPLVFLSFSLEHSLWGLNPFGYHLTNLLLHVCNTLLVFALVWRLTGQYPVGFVAALLFGVHPLHVESVAWVTERKDMLSTLFFLGALLSYLKYQENQRIRFYLISLGAFFLSLLSKPMGVTLPLILFLCDYLLARKWTSRTVLEKVPFLTLSAVAGIVEILGEHLSGGIVLRKLPAVGDNLLIGFRNLGFYLGKTLAPVGLSAFYPYPREIAVHLPVFFLSVVLFVVLALAVWASSRYTRQVVFGSLFFFITILPILKVIPYRGPEVAADRYTYIPSIGLFYLGSLAVWGVWNWKTRWEAQKRVFLALFVASSVVTLAVLTWQRSNVWQNSETLWLSVLAVDPDSSVAHNNLGAVYGTKGLLEKALAHYQKAVFIDPTYAVAHNNLGAVYGEKGLLDEALAEYQKAIALDPSNAPARFRLGKLYDDRGQLDAAMAEYRKGIALDPTYAPGHNNLGAVYETKGLLDEALAEYQKAVAIDPGYAVARNNLGALYGKRGQFDAALAEYQKAIAIDPAFAIAHYNAGLIYERKRLFDEAVAAYRKAVRFEPNQRVFSDHLASALRADGQSQAADEILQRIPKYSNSQLR